MERNCHIKANSSGAPSIRYPWAMPDFVIHVATARDVDVPSSAPLRYGFVRPKSPVSTLDDSFVVRPDRDRDRELARRFIEAFRAQKRRGRRPVELVEFFVGGPPPLSDRDAWTAQRVADWGAVALDAVLGLFPAGEHAPLIFDAATSLKPGLPFAYLAMVPRVQGKAGLLRLSWHELQQAAAAQLAGIPVSGGAAQMSCIREGLYAKAGAEWALRCPPRKDGAAAMVFVRVDDLDTLKRERRAALDDASDSGTKVAHARAKADRAERARGDEAAGRQAAAAERDAALAARDAMARQRDAAAAQRDAAEAKAKAAADQFAAYKQQATALVSTLQLRVELAVRLVIALLAAMRRLIRRFPDVADPDAYGRKLFGDARREAEAALPGVDSSFLDQGVPQRPSAAPPASSP